MSRIVVVTAVGAEADAVLGAVGPGEPVEVGPYRGRWAKTGAGEVVVLAGGVGPARAAACAGAALAAERPDAVVSAGVAGGFRGRAAVGDVVIADAVVHADLGAESPDGFLSVADLGFGDAVARLPEALVAGIAARTGGIVGPVLTVSTVTGTDASAAVLADRHRPVAEAMEGAGVLAAAEAHGIPFAEIRAVSNLVGRREPAAWDLAAAFGALERAFARLLAAPLPTGVGAP
jgi:futalosine hydrolase